MVHIHSLSVTCSSDRYTVSIKCVVQEPCFLYESSVYIYRCSIEIPHGFKNASQAAETRRPFSNCFVHDAPLERDSRFVVSGRKIPVSAKSKLNFTIVGQGSAIIAAISVEIWEKIDEMILKISRA